VGVAEKLRQTARNYERDGEGGDERETNVLRLQLEDIVRIVASIGLWRVALRMDRDVARQGMSMKQTIILLELHWECGQ